MLAFSFAHPDGSYSTTTTIHRAQTVTCYNPGQFKPTPISNPAIGTAGGQLELEPETRVEVMCPSADVTRQAVRKLKESHPYEVPVYEVYRLEDF